MQSADVRRADVIVVGLGIMGSAGAHALATRGVRVIGLEAGPPGHALGSSHGPTRIIRHAIEESPAYGPIITEAFARWQEMEDETGQTLLTLCGVLRFGPPDSPLLALTRASAAAGGLALEDMTAAEVNRRFPAFHLPPDHAAVFEPHGGVVHASRALQGFQDRAACLGADLRFGERVVAWRAAPGGTVEVRTNGATYAADRLILTAGPWLSQLVPDLRLPLTVQRVVNVTFQPLDPARYGPDRCPSFIGLDGDDGYYGCPAVAGEGVKVGGGTQPTDPDDVRRQVTDDDVEPMRSFVARFLPRAAGPVASAITCLYTETPDGQFIVDTHPAHPEVVIASPCSGHGFKHASAIGPILGDLAVTGATAHDIGFLAIDRFDRFDSLEGRPQSGAAAWRRPRATN